ncbi:hypothetical protein [Chryseobacterium sp. EO14]|uniref:hypothetical protein n=1 Tax=Chryseobacterium sp. EO14 TaxID=2950551 RepID=UPI00210A9441|nr:hypothetical protein [Chryseobacterium sp. EO14]MCQ4139989.1 hypothetical protein [Chryseobacterium sp. EO14]
MSSELSTKDILYEIIELSYDILIKKLGHGSLKALNEASFQLEFGHILKTLGNLYEFDLEDKFYLEFETPFKLKEDSFKSKTKKARIDLFIRYQSNGEEVKAAIELKFFKKSNHREPNNRYDVFQDLKNLEDYKDNDIDICYFILATDHKHYCYQDTYSADTADFDFRHEKEYQAGKILKYSTTKPYGEEVSLKNNYKFEWTTIKNLNFLKLKI